MKVGELLKELSRMDADAEVFVLKGDEAVEAASLTKAELSEFDPLYHQLVDGDLVISEAV